MIKNSKLYVYIEYEETAKGIIVRNHHDGVSMLISKKNTNQEIRQFKQEIIDDIVELMPSVHLKECKVCHREYYTQYRQQRNCSKECSEEAQRESDRRCKQKKRQEELAGTNAYTNRDTDAGTDEEALGLSYGKRKALKFMEENREELWGSLYSEIKKVQ